MGRPRAWSASPNLYEVAAAMTSPEPLAPQRTPVTLWLLSLANFAVGMGGFVVIGILSPVATDLAISRAAAGSLMTLYAMVYAISSPLLVASTGRLDRRSALIGGMATFTLGAVAAALASGLTGLLIARSIMAVGAGMVTPLAASVAIALAAPAGRGRALALVFGGLTLAQALGVPLGAWLGYQFGWRAAFATVVGLGALSLAALYVCLPRGISVPVASLRSLFSVFASARETVAVSFTALFMGGLYVFFTFTAPFLEARYLLARDGVTIVLALFGIGAVLGNSMGGLLTDRIGPNKTLVLLCLSQLILLPLITLVTLPLVGFAATMLLWSVCSWSVMVPQQARLALLSPTKISVLLALNASAIYLGSSIGSALGGVLMRSDDPFSWLGPAGALLMLVALASLAWPHGHKPTPTR